MPYWGSDYWGGEFWDAGYWENFLTASGSLSGGTDPGTGIVGHGSTIGIDPTNVGSVYLDLGLVFDITAPEKTAAILDTTNLYSPYRHREFRQGIIDPGEAIFKCIFEKEQLYALIYYQNTGQDYYWQVTFPDAPTPPECSRWRFLGFIARVGEQIPLDDKVVVDVSIKLTGRPEFIRGSYTYPTVGGVGSGGGGITIE